jgi:hypothetical protein
MVVEIFIQSGVTVEEVHEWVDLLEEWAKKYIEASGHASFSSSKNIHVLHASKILEDR